MHNPQLPLLYGQPKIHKIGNKMRPVVSSYMSPFYKLAKWIVGEFNTLPPPPGFDVKNVYEFVDKVKDITLEPVEIIVSYDVISLYPNVPIPEALQIVNDWLFESGVSDTKADLLFRTTRQCMEQNFFQYNNKFYKQTFGANMGNPLSCFVANAFLGELELKLKKKGLLPRIWLRYVDDIFAVVKRSEADSLISTLNSQSTTIKFTLDKENENGSLPFLDVLITRVNNKLDFSVYRKPTNTDRYITNDSYRPKSTKLAAFNSMVYRLCKLPLSIRNYMKELENIKRIANVNGYAEEKIEKMVEKHSRNIKRLSLTTLNKQAEATVRAPFKFIHHITNHLKPIMKQVTTVSP